MSQSATGVQYAHWAPRAAPSGVLSALRGLIVLGLVVFVLGLVLGYSQRAWQIYFVNFLFWTGIAQSGVIMSAVYRITNSHWGEPFRRIGESMIGFLPLSIILYVVLVIGGGFLFPWVRETTHGKGFWLNPAFVFGRDGLIFLFLLWLSYRFVRYSVRLDLGILKDKDEVPDLPWWGKRIVGGWQGMKNEEQLSVAGLTRLTPILLIAFVVLYSLIGFDLLMALDPQWYSTLFGWMYVLHAFFAGLVVITILAVLSRSWFDLGAAFTTGQWHDMGRFVFGFCLLSGGFFWSQFLVIWYGNLPEETSYVIKRFYSQPWEPLMWVYLIFAYLFPLVVFLSKKVKQVPTALMVIALVILCALFIERFVAVVPFLWSELSIPFGLIEVGVTAGFLAAFLLCWVTFSRVVPLVPLSLQNAGGD